MFVLVEIHSDEIDQTCRMVGAFDNEGTARTVMHQLYLDAHERNKSCVPETSHLEADEARAWWPDATDFYDWNIFNTERN